MTAASSIGVGLIGTGFMGKCHALAWNAVAPTFGDVTAPRRVHLADVEPDRARRAAVSFGFERASTDWRAVVADPDVTVVSIAAPNQFHADMAVAALEAGKDVWCEKPMATTLDDARRMAAAARASGRVAALGYNYVQNPAIRHAAELLRAAAIGRVTYVRAEMDEDFMADGTAPFGPKDAATSGYGALDDFAVHPLSLLHVLVGLPTEVLTDQAHPYCDRAHGNGRRAVETHDIASVLLRLADGTSGVLMVNRAAWGRKGRIRIQIFGSEGALVYDQERLNELQLYRTADVPTRQGFRTILTGPRHPPYGCFVPAPGHGLGFNDLKVIECREVIRRIGGAPAHIVEFDAGLAIEAVVHAMAESHHRRAWVAAADPIPA